MSQSGKLSAKQVQAVSCLLEGNTVQATAERVGVTSRTLHRWLKEPEFRQELIRAEGEVLAETTRHLVSLSILAVDALQDVLNHPEQRGAANKRLAAVAILEQVVRLKDFQEIEERISNLERVVLNGRKNQAP